MIDVTKISDNEIDYLLSQLQIERTKRMESKKENA